MALTRSSSVCGANTHHFFVTKEQPLRNQKGVSKKRGTNSLSSTIESHDADGKLGLGGCHLPEPVDESKHCAHALTHGTCLFQKEKKKEVSD